MPDTSFCMDNSSQATIAKTLPQTRIAEHYPMIRSLLNKSKHFCQIFIKIALLRILRGIYYNERRKVYYPSMRNLSTNLLRKKYTQLAGSFDAAVPTLQHKQIKEI